LEQITGYDFFSNLPVDVQVQLEARKTDRFINGVPLLADNPLISSKIFPFQSGESVNLPRRQGNSDSPTIVVRNIADADVGSSKVSISKAEIGGNNILKISSSKGGFLERSFTQIGSFKRGIVQVAPIEVNTKQDTIIKVGSTQVGILESSPIQVSTLQTGSFQVGIVEHNVLQVSPSEISPNQNNSSQIQVVQTGIAPINTREVSFSSINPSFQLFSIHNAILQIINQINIV
jgi:hypothetical protein